jgi:hypothetical protein
MKNLKLFIAFIIITASLSAKAQTYIGIKCPECKSNTWTYTKMGYYETIENQDTSITVDWKTLEVVHDGKPFTIKTFKISADEPKATIRYFNKSFKYELIIWYDAQGRYKAHQLKELV